MKASILIRAYNAESTIERAVLSALGQDFPRDEFEVIVVNDGSTDRTRAILKTYAKSPHLFVVDQENKGGVTTANTVLRRSSGEYVTFLDSDDEFSPDYLKELTHILDQHPEIDFVYPDYYEEFKGKRSLVIPQNIFENVMIGILFRKDGLERVGYYRENVFFTEYDLFLRTLDEWQGYHYARPLFIYHRRLDSITGDKKRVEEGIQQLKELHPDKFDFIKKIRPYNLYVRC